MNQTRALLHGSLLNNKKIIKSVTLDSVVQSLSLKPKFIKIDVEGAEFDVLQGMQETLKKYKPEIMLEKHPSLVPKNIILKDIDNYIIVEDEEVLLIYPRADEQGIKNVRHLAKDKFGEDLI